MVNQDIVVANLQATKVIDGSQATTIRDASEMRPVLESGLPSKDIVVLSPEKPSFEPEVDEPASLCDDLSDTSASELSSMGSQYEDLSTRDFPHAHAFDSQELSPWAINPCPPSCQCQLAMDWTQSMALQFALSETVKAYQVHQHSWRVTDVLSIATQFEWILSSSPPVEVLYEDMDKNASFHIPDMKLGLENGVDEHGVPCGLRFSEGIHVQHGWDFPLARVPYGEIIVHFWLAGYPESSFPFVLPIWDGARPVTRNFIAGKLVQAVQTLHQAIATKPDIYVPVQEELRLLPWNLPGFIGIGINHLRLNGLSHYRGRHFVVNITVIKPSTKNDYWF
ncbi:unnamed protein product [Somion occarium]|uniref:Uncharacterized protein n=1 Tax=Somion occarium TaxID=3059160 RepID=A0ABP1DNQ4_9APHY